VNGPLVCAFSDKKFGFSALFLVITRVFQPQPPTRRRRPSIQHAQTATAVDIEQTQLNQRPSNLHFPAHRFFTFPSRRSSSSKVYFSAYRFEQQGRSGDERRYPTCPIQRHLSISMDRGPCRLLVLDSPTNSLLLPVPRAQHDVGC
jgi:hypothetical protein